MDLIIVILILVFLFCILIAREFYRVAEMKGFPESKYFWIAFLFPIIGYLLVIALPDKNLWEICEAISTPETTSPKNDELPDL